MRRIVHAIEHRGKLQNARTALIIDAEKKAHENEKIKSGKNKKEKGRRKTTGFKSFSHKCHSNKYSLLLLN